MNVQEKNHRKTIAMSLLQNIVSQIEKQDINYQCEVEFNSEVIKIDCKNGQYVINTQYHVGEIWLSSPISGPHHFKYLDENTWINRDNQDIRTILNQELLIFGIKIEH